MTMLPPRYADWLTDLLGGTLPEEQAATCSRCAMQGEAVAEGYRFRADAKCCTYVPALANFLVGAALRELPPGPALASLELRLTALANCTPHGLDVGEAERAAYQAVVASESFGRDPSLRCPHYLHEQGGLCGIWRHRNGVCATWFCKHDRGAAGQRFWQAVEAMLTAIERELCHWCACQLLYNEAPTPAEGDDESLPEWAAWLPRRREYYVRAAALVDELSWAEVQVIGGAELAELAGRVRAAYAEIRPIAGARAEGLVPLRRPPGVLVTGAVKLAQRGPERSRVVSYSDSDALDLPSELVELLPRFDGRATEVVLAELAGEGVVLTPDLVARLVDFAVLREP